MEEPQSEMKRKNKGTRRGNHKYRPHKLQIQIKKKSLSNYHLKLKPPYNYYLETTEIYEERELRE